MPVEIERHTSAEAHAGLPDTFAAQPEKEQLLSERRAARAAQVLVVKDRLIRHQRWAIELMSMCQGRRDEAILRARAEVAKSRRLGLCSSDYANRWDDLLQQPVADLVRAMASDEAADSASLRQNSPWPVAMP